MVYPGRLSRALILGAAVRIVDEQGVEALSLRPLAEALGVRASSLYKHVADKEALLRWVAEFFVEDLAAACAPHPASLDAFGHAYRKWALAYPCRYAVIFRSAPVAEQPALDIRLRAVEPLRVLAASFTPHQPLVTARAIWSYLHGAVSLELLHRDQTRAGLDETAAFETGLQALERGLAAS